MTNNIVKENPKWVKPISFFISPLNSIADVDIFKSGTLSDFEFSFFVSSDLFVLVLMF